MVCSNVGKLETEIQSFDDRPLHHEATLYSKELRRPNHSIFDSDRTILDGTWIFNLGSGSFLKD